jgi:hypothetical protein
MESKMSIDKILGELSGTGYDIAIEARNVSELLEAEKKAKQALYQRLSEEAVDVLYVADGASKKLYSEKPNKAIPLSKLAELLGVKE